MHGHLNVKTAIPLLPLWTSTACSRQNFCLTFHKSAMYSMNQYSRLETHDNRLGHKTVVKDVNSNLANFPTIY
jgi:hypothetical protein